MALIDTASGVREGEDVVVDVRGRRITAQVVELPFVRDGRPNLGGG
jgi:aminomethyltransferase